MGKQTEDEDLVPVGPGVDDESSDKDLDEKVEKKAEAKEDEEEADSEKDSGEEARLGHSEDEEEEEKPRKYKRWSEMTPEEKKEAKQRKKIHEKDKKERDRREMEFLRKRNEQLERRFSHNETRIQKLETMTIDQRIAWIDQQLSLADDVEATALEKNSGKDAVEARNIREGLKEAKAKLVAAKAGTTASTNKEPGMVDPQVMENAGKFIKSNPWYNPTVASPDSALVKTMDDAVAAEGYDPKTPEYWDELQRRIKRRLPHHFKGAKNGKDSVEDIPDEDDEEEDESGETTRKEPKKGGKGPRFSTGGREVRLTKGQVYVSPERKAALQEMGAWDDPQLRQKYLKAYAKYDREASDRN